MNPSCIQEVRRVKSPKPPTEPAADRLVREGGSTGARVRASMRRRHRAAESDHSGTLLRQRNHTVGVMQVSSGDMDSWRAFRGNVRAPVRPEAGSSVVGSPGCAPVLSYGRLSLVVNPRASSVTRNGFRRRGAPCVYVYIVHERMGIPVSGACFVERWGDTKIREARPAWCRSGFEALVRTVIVGCPSIRSLRPFRAAATRRGARVTF